MFFSLSLQYNQVFSVTLMFMYYVPICPARVARSVDVVLRLDLRTECVWFDPQLGRFLSED